MFNNSDYNVNRHSNTKLKFILGVKTHESKKIIKNSIEKELIYLIQRNFVQQHKCIIENIEFEEENSVKIYFEAPINLILTHLISNFKTISSRILKKKFGDELVKYKIKEKFWDSKYYLRTLAS